MNDYLNQFYQMEHHREAVRAFLLETLDDIALREAYKHDGDTFGLPFARDTIIEVFSRLEELYGAKDKPLPVNNAR